ncbi:purine-binding chemotaxis protein CheW [Ancylobacter sonchi]|uniref:chemotaxis protein CheW n=1 Tax=Ancylobacter sonchi TaxID=1937790 RepID=UPI001BD2B123|nr:chemotaxis protein CheW [Ancylobacter sonchi]MBS7533142.1 purine-binding chemotaxis protein CheW [Ancylobacter sonchi]
MSPGADDELPPPAAAETSSSVGAELSHRDAAHQAAASRLLDRALPPGYREEWARYFAEVPDEEAAAEASEVAERRILVFRLADEWLALPAGLVQEITEPRPRHTLPHRRDQLVLGVVNIRGELLVEISFAALIGLGEAEGEAESRITAFPRLVVLGHDRRRVAFRVDEVHGLHQHAARDVLALPATIGKAASSFATSMIAWQGRMLGRLDGELVLDAVDRGIA